MTIARSRDSHTNNVQLSHNIFHVEIYSIATASERDSRTIRHADAHQQVHPGPKTSSPRRRSLSPARLLPLVEDGRTFTSPTVIVGQADQCKTRKLKFGRLLLHAIAEGKAETGRFVPHI